LFAYFVAMLIIWMRFTSSARELRRDVLIMLETHIIMSSLIFRLILILLFCLVLILVLCLTLLLILCPMSILDLTIAHIVLVYERIALSPGALVTAHVLIVVIVSCVGSVFLL
jgi:hypothetical protein